MKTKLHLLLIGLFSLTLSINAQFIEYGRDSKWNIGLNMGGVWQDADINLEHPGFGYGFTLGRAIYERPGAFWGLDLRFRYLRGHSYGLDPERFLLDSTYSESFGSYADSVGYTYLNNKTDIHDYSLEAVLKFHRLREQTGILFHVFGGVGITDYQTKMNLFDENEAIYDYSSQPVTADQVMLADMLDGTYESNAPTHAERNIKFMPSLGVGIGYQVTPVISIGLEHRTTFTLNDYFDGVTGEGSEFINPKSGNDIYHYSSLFFRWNIMKGKSVTDDSYQPDCDKPYVAIDAPIEGQTFLDPNTSFSARVTRINGNNDIILKVNGRAVSTQYSHSTELVTANITLSKGKNIIELTAVNSCGRTVEIRNVIYDSPECPTPLVSITSPFGGAVTNPSQIVQANIKDLDGGTVALTVNGRAITPSYNASTGVLTTNVTLVEGNNTIEVVASNGCGEDRKTVTVTYTPPCDQPQIAINAPFYNQNFSTPAISFRANVLNVDNRSNITLLLNGANAAFTFSGNQMAAALNLRKGSNTILVRAANACGNVEQTVIVTYDAPCPQPSVSIMQPITGRTYTTQSVSLTALAGNISSPNQIVVTLNNRIIPFTYNNATRNITSNLTLVEGNNTVTVQVKNDCGQDDKSLIINYVAPCDAPSISMRAPQDGAQTANEILNISGTVANLNSKNELQVIVNGIPQAFNYTSGTFSAQVKVKPGKNSIEIKATTSCGSVSKNITVTYNAPCNAPIVTLNSPTATTTNNSKAALSANVSNVNSLNEVSVYLNNALQTGVTLFGGKVSGTLNLRQGTNVIRVVATNGCGSDQKQVIVTYNAPCVSPTVNITSPVGTVAPSAKVSLTASVTSITSANEVAVYLNNAVQSGISYSNGKVVGSINLRTGKNVIRVVATNGCGSDQKQLVLDYSTPCNLPVINMRAPQDGAQTKSELLNVSGTVTNIQAANQIQIKVNGVAQQVNFSSGTFSSQVKLNGGKNRIDIIAQNDCGADSKGVEVTYNVPCTLPKVTITSPAQTYVKTASVKLLANVIGVKSISEVAVYLNNNLERNMTYTNGFVSGMLNLNDGKNVIRVVATNSCGTDQQQVVITYSKPCDKPSVNMRAPSNGSQTSEETINISGTASNVTSARDLTIMVNNRVAIVNYNGGTFTAKAKLQAGTNTIVVSAKTDCGVDSKTVAVTYNKPCPKPSATVSAPSTSVTHKTKQLDFRAGVTDVSSSGDIKVKLNGKIVPFNFDGKSVVTGTLTGMVNGNNTLYIEVSNSCGNRLFTHVFKYEVVKPVIVLSSPTNGSSTEETQVKVTGYVKGVDNDSQITFKLNNKLIRVRVLKQKDGSYKYDQFIPVDMGSNTLRIDARNNFGYSESKSVTFERIKPAVKSTGTGSMGTGSVGGSTGTSGGTVAPKSGTTGGSVGAGSVRPPR